MNPKDDQLVKGIYIAIEGMRKDLAKGTLPKDVEAKKRASLKGLESYVQVLEMMQQFSSYDGSDPFGYGLFVNAEEPRKPSDLELAVEDLGKLRDRRDELFSELEELMHDMAETEKKILQLHEED